MQHGAQETGCSMAIRRRTWRTNGKALSAYVVDYRDIDGKRRNKQFPTRKAAEDWAAQTHIDVKHGIHIPDAESVTVEHAGKLWLAACKKTLVQSSYERNRQHVDLHIVPLIGTTRLNQLNAPAVRAFEDRMRATGRSAPLTKAVLVSLGTMLADAGERGLTVTNAVRNLKRTRGKRRGGASEKPKKPLAIGEDIPHPNEVAAILKAATGHARRLAMFSLLAFTGLRGSELRGLRWQDVDLVGSRVTVSQRADAWKTIAQPKSAAGYRTIPLPPGVVKALKEWKLQCPKSKLGLVFPSELGGVMEHQRIVSRQWQPLQIKAGVALPFLDQHGKRVEKKDGKPVMAAKYSGLHALRHFYASWCAARREDGGLGLPLKTVQVRMGHSTLAMTADTYGHLFPSTDDAEVLAAGERALMGV
jgi:integrase